jgi:hypothetical protein
MMCPAPLPERDMWQPNAGWAQLCESCRHRDRTDLGRDCFPCKACTFYYPVRHPEHGNMLVTNLTRWIDGSETCSDYEAEPH